jgi:hypothetical protein
VPLPPSLIQPKDEERIAQASGGSNYAQANEAMKLTPEEQALYERHLTNLNGPGGVDNPDGSRSSIRNITVEMDGKTYVLPTIYDGKILSTKDAVDKAKSIGLDKFPSYDSQDEAESRYNQMHDYMEKDTANYLGQRSDIGQLSTAGVREAGLQPGAVGPAQNVNAVQRTNYLTNQRTRLKDEIEKDPRLKLRLAAIIDLENPSAGTAVAESLFNRSVYTGRSVAQGLGGGAKSFYGPERKGLVEARMRELQSDPRRLQQRYNQISEAYSSNYTKGNTDQGSSGDPNYLTGGVGENINGERFNDFGGGPGGIAGARQFRIAQQGLAGQPSLPMSEISPFLNPEPTATQNVALQGGLADTPIAAAQTAALMQGTPLEKMKAVSDAMTAATKRGIDEPQVPIPGRRVTHTRQGVPTIGTLPQSPYMTSPPQQTLPTPGLAPTATPSSNVIQDLTNPSVLATIQNATGVLNPAMLAQSPTPPAPPPPPQGDFAYLDKLQQLVQAMKGSNKDDAINAAKSVAAGVLSQPVQAFNTTVAPASMMAGMLLDNDALKWFGAESMARGDQYQKDLRDAMGLPQDQSRGQAMGQFVGSNLGPSVLRTLGSMAISKGFEAAQPTFAQLGQSYPVPSIPGMLSTPAEAATVFGKPPVVINTPGGPVTMNDAQMSELVWGAGAALGFGFLPAVTARTTRVAREGSAWLRDWTNPTRDVPGAPGTMAASLPIDVLKAGTLDVPSAMIDVINRMGRYAKDPQGDYVKNPTFWDMMKGRDHGIDPVAAEQVKQKFGIQTRSGQQNLIKSALTDGKMTTPDFKFDVPLSMGELAKYTRENPDFAHYIKANMLAEQLEVNNQLRTTLPSGQPRTQLTKLADPPPARYKDINGEVWTRNGQFGTTSARQTVRDYEAANPDFRQAYQHLQNNLAETRRFVSDSQYAAQNPTELSAMAQIRPTMPIFDERGNQKVTLQRILNNDNPLRVIEDTMRKAMGSTLDNDARHTLVNASPPGAFTPRSEKWVRNNGQVAAANGAILPLRLNGDTVHYTTDPFLASALKSGEPVSNLGSYFTSLAKKPFTFTTTGPWMPTFAPVAMLRALEQGWTTYPIGIVDRAGKPIGPVGLTRTLGAIPRAAIPQIAHIWTPTAKAFEGWISNNPIGRMIPPQYHNLISRTFEQAWNNSLYAKLKESGGVSGEIVRGEREINQGLASAKLQYPSNHPVSPILDYMSNAARTFGRYLSNVYPIQHGWTHPYGKGAEITRQAVVESPGFAWASKAMNRGAQRVVFERDPQGNLQRRYVPLDPSALGMYYRDYTGDPSVRGSPFYREGGGAKLLKYQGPNMLGAGVAKGAGVITAGLREIIPWSGVLVQSPARTIKALRDNPVRANMAYTLGTVMPQVVAYLWNMQQGQQYVDYDVDQRSEYAQNNNIYIAVPGKKPYQGLELSWYQEAVFPKVLAKSLAHQYYGRSNQNGYQDIWDAVKAFVGTNISPPFPPLLNAGLAAGTGMVLPPGGFIGDIYQRKVNPYDVGYKENNIELGARQMFPGVADIWLQMMHAMSDVPEGSGAWATAKAGIQQGAERALQKTAILRDITSALGGDYTQQVSGSPVVNQKLFELDHTISDLAKRYDTWERNKGAVSLKSPGVSGAGMAKVGPFMPQLPPTVNGKIPNPGVSVAEPKNPLYSAFMKQMEETFKKDSPEKGGIGYRSMWKNYSIWTQELKRLSTVSRGDDQVWLKEMEKQPRLIDYLKKQEVDPTNYKAVKDFYGYQRQLVGKMILNTIQATEQKFDKLPMVRQKLGPTKHFSIKMLSPNEPGMNADTDQ